MKMRLYSFISSLALLSTIFSVIVTATSDDSTPVQLKCRCLPSQPCWPNQDQWSELSQSVGGRLISTRPAAYECHDPHYNKDKCDEIKKGYFFDTWRQLQPGAVLQTNFEVVGDQGCLGVNRTAPCNQGAVPLYTIEAKNTEDIQNAIKFALKHNIRLVVKNTGHDFAGRSTGPSSLSLWIHALKDIDFNDEFVPEGAPVETNGVGAIILGGGVMWGQANKAAYEHGVIVVGGDSMTVGTSGGYCQGGGHSPISRLHGLCVDNVLQYKVVTADGDVKIANSYQNTDLFWALRGGGGGTFGVVVEAVFKTHPALKNTNYAEYKISYNSADSSKVINNFYSHQTKWSDEGWSGYAFVYPDHMRLMKHWPNSDHSKAIESMSPFLEYAKSLDSVTVEGNVRDFPTYWDYYQAYASPDGIPKPNAGFNVILGSRLLPRKLFESEKGTKDLTEASVDIFDSGVNNGSFIYMLVAGGEVSKGNSIDTSVLPAWREAFSLIVYEMVWADTASQSDKQFAARKVTSTTGILRRLVPNSGTYVNEADVNEPNWQENFWGDNYSRLKSIKDKVDPHGLFACRHCIGSEEWNGDFNCPRKLKKE